MKNTIKVLGILLVIAAAIFVAACGPIDPVEPDPDTYTITFMNGSQIFSTVKDKNEGDLVPAPSPGPTADKYVAPEIPKTAGFYKLNASNVSFGGWSLTSGGEAFTGFPLTVTGNQTFYAIWTGGGNWELVTVTDASDGLKKYIETMGSPVVGDQFALVLDNDISQSTYASMNKPNSNLTITSNNTVQRKIKSTYGSSMPFLTIGVGSTSNPDASIKLTLKNIILEGKAGVDANGKLDKSGSVFTMPTHSLVQVQNGAILTLDDQAVVRGHRNNTYNTSNGTNGNGSAVCVRSATLNMLTGSMIEENEAINFNTADGLDAASTSNRNYVGGVYTIKDSNSSPIGPTLNITGGVIKNNYCKPGNTQDVYATEGGTFTLSGATTIGELTINADPAGASAIPATIIVSGLNNPVGTLSLRSTTDKIATVKTTWEGKHILLGPGSTATTAVDPAPADVAKFTLGDFKGGNGAGYEAIKDDEYGINTDGTLLKKK